MNKVRNLPTCFPTVLVFHDNNSCASVLPQQGSNRSVMGNGWWTIEETRIFTLARHWVLQDWDTHFASVPHLTYLPTSQAQMHHRYGSSQSVSASGFFLFSLISPSAGGPLLSPPVRCSVMLFYSFIWHHFPQFQSQLLLIYPSFFCHSHSSCKLDCSALSHMISDN